MDFQSLFNFFFLSNGEVEAAPD